MLEENRLLGEGKTIERRVSLSRIVSAEGFTPSRCRYSYRHLFSKLPTRKDQVGLNVSLDSRPHGMHFILSPSAARPWE